VISWVIAAMLAGGVHWDAPQECPSAERLIADAEALSGRRISDAMGLEVRGSVRAEDGGRWVLSLEIATASGSQARVLEAGSCQDLTDVAATLIAVALQEPSPEPPPPEPDPEPERPEPAPPPANEPASAAVRRPWVAVLDVAGSVGLGPLPGPAAVLSISAGAERGLLRVEAEADVWLPRDARLGADAGGSVTLWALGARGCGVPKAARVRFPLCAGVQAGQMLGHGVGLDVSRRAALPWLAAEVTAGLRVDVLSHLAVRADLSMLVPVLRPGFTIDGRGTLHRAAAVGGTAGVGLEVRLP